MSRLNIVSILIQIMAAALIAARTCKAVSSPRTNEPSSSSLSVVDLEAGDVADAAMDGWRRRRQNLPRAFQDEIDAKRILREISLLHYHPFDCCVKLSSKYPDPNNGCRSSSPHERARPSHHLRRTSHLA